MQVNMHEAKTQLSKLAARAVAGERVVIAKAGEPLVELIPVKTEPRKRLKLGLYKDQLQISDDDWAEHKRHIAELFEDSANAPIEPDLAD